MLNDVSLAEAWMGKDAFTISAVGHAADVTVLDALSDVSCETPTAAGAYLRQAVLDTAGVAREGRRLAWLVAEHERLGNRLARQRLYVRILAAAAAVFALLWLVASVT